MMPARVRMLAIHIEVSWGSYRLGISNPCQMNSSNPVEIPRELYDAPYVRYFTFFPGRRSSGSDKLQNMLCYLW